MKAFNLRISTENAAFDDNNHDAEIARILRHVADRIDANGATTYRHMIHDMNGNHVGGYNTEA